MQQTVAKELPPSPSRNNRDVPEGEKALTIPLFCKPSREAVLSSQILFSKCYPEVNGTISFRSLHLQKDLSIIHDWVNKQYALEYWQMNGHFSQLYAIYQCMELNPYCHSFVGILTPSPQPSPLVERAEEASLSSQPPSPKGGKSTSSMELEQSLEAGDIICQFDVYSVFADELNQHVETEPNDCGFHLLMAPNENPVPGLTAAVINAFLEHYFTFSEAKRMYAEPDVNNLKSIALLERAGFHRIKSVEMSYKQAYVYVRSRSS